MKKIICMAILLLVINPSSGYSQKISRAKLDSVLQRASDQYKYLMQRLPKGEFPKTYHAMEDRLETSDSEWWCSGFYPGTLLKLFQYNGDASLKKEADRILLDLEKEQFNTGTHDLGFMMYCSFGLAEEIEPKTAYREILMNSAKSLATRFNGKVGCIRSWNSKDDSFLVIIDNMMNLELLFWASDFSGDPQYADIAIAHADTTIKNHFRNDFSSYHVLDYNETTGEVMEKRTAQGFADESAWARGQAWGLYGYTATYRITKDPKYLHQAVKIADFMLNDPNLPLDKVPYWDYDAETIPDALRDSSAGAIMASALLELANYVDEAKAKRYFQDAETALNTLIGPEYIAQKGENGGFLLKHGVGHLPQKSEVDVPLTYGDYYLVEALQRYMRSM